MTAGRRRTWQWYLAHPGQLARDAARADERALSRYEAKQDRLEVEADARDDDRPPSEDR